MMIVITQLLNKDMVLQLATILCCTNCKDNLFSESKDSMQKSTLATLGSERKKPSAESKKWRENVIAIA